MPKVIQKNLRKLLIASLILGGIITTWARPESAFASAKIQTSSTNVTVGETFTLSVQIYGAAWDVSIYTTGPTNDCSLHGVDFSPSGDNADYTYTRTCTATSAGTITAVLSGLISYADLSEVPISGNVSISVMTPPDPTPIKPSIPEDTAPPPLGATTTEETSAAETNAEEIEKTEKTEEELEAEEVDNLSTLSIPAATTNRAADTRRTFTALSGTKTEESDDGRLLIILTVVGLITIIGIIVIMLIARKRDLNLKPQIKLKKPKLPSKIKLPKPADLKAFKKKLFARKDPGAAPSITSPILFAEPMPRYAIREGDVAPAPDGSLAQSEALVRRFSDPKNKISRSEVEALYHYPSPSLLVPTAEQGPDAQEINAHEARGYAPMPEMKKAYVPNPFDLGYGVNNNYSAQNYNPEGLQSPQGLEGNLAEENWNFNENLITHF